MKNTYINTFTALAAIALLGFSVPAADAASANWNVDASGNWSLASNWNPAVVPGIAAGDVVGLNFNITAARTVTLNTPATLGVLNLGDPTAPFFGYTLAGSSTLTFNNSGNGALLTQTTVGGAADLISAPIALGDNLTILNANGLTLSGVISGSGKSVAKIGAGTLTINGSAVNTYTGTNTVGGGTLVEDFANLASPVNLINSGSALVMNGGTLQIKQQSATTTSQTFNGVTISANTANAIIGTGVGGGALTVALGAITHKVGGTVDFTNTSTGFITTTTANDATGIFGGWATVGNNLGSVATGGWACNDGANNIVPYTAYTVVSSGGSTTPSLTGSSTQNWLSGSYPGNAGNYVSTLSGSATINSIVMCGDITVPNGATLTLGSGGIIFYGNSRWILNNGGGSVNGTAKLASGLATGELYLHTPWTAYSGNWEIWPTIIDGAVPTTVTKDGPGLLILANTNTYSGGTVVNAGQLEVLNNVGNGSVFGSGPVTINPGGQVFFNFGSEINTNNYILNGKTVSGAILAGNQGAGNVCYLVGSITLNADANIASWWNDKTLELAGQITGPGGLTFDLDTYDGTGAGGRYVITNSANNYAGNTIVNGRSTGGNAYIVSGTNNALPVTTTLTLNYADLILMGYNQTLSGLNDTNTTATLPGTVYTTTGTGGPYADQVVNYSTTSVLLTINNTASNSFSGVLGGTGANENNFALTKQGAGIQALAGTNTYANGTLISGGTLQIGNGGASGSIVGIVTNNSVLAFNLSGISTFANQIVGTGSVAQNSASSGIVILSATNSYGATIVNSGTLWITNTTTTTGVTVKSGGSFGGPGTVAGNVAWQAGSSGSFILATNYSATGNNSTPFTVSGTVALSNNPVTINVVTGPVQPGTYTLMKYTSAGSSGSFITNGGPSFTGAGVVGGTISTITTGGGTVTLTVSVAPTGTWTNNVASSIWSQGTNWSSNPRVPHAVGDLAVLGVGSGLTTVTLDQPETVGMLTFSNANSFVIASAGNTLTLDNFGGGASVGVTGGTANSIATAVSLNDSASFNVSSNQSLSVSGPISSTSASETLAVTGPGTLALSGTNSYGPAAGTAGTTMSGGGVLQLGNNSSLGSGDLSFTANGTLQAGTALNLSNNVVISSGVATLNANGNAVTLSGLVSGPGALTKAGAGVLTLPSVNSYTGGTTVNQGMLVVPTNAVVNSGGTGNVLLNVGSLNNIAVTNIGVVNINGGTINAGNTTTYLGGVNVGIATNAVGVVNMTSGTLNIYSAQLLLGAGGAGVNGFGALNMSGGSLTAAGGITLSRASATTGNNNGELILSGGTITVGGGQFSIGGYQNANTLNVATLTGGSITNSVNTYVGEANSGSARGVLNISGNAVLTITNTAAALELGVNAGGSGIVNLNGGTIVAPAVFKGAGANGYPNNFNFNGGTLKFNVGSLTNMVGLNGAYVWSGGAIIDNGGNNITIPQALLAPTGNGVGLGTLQFGGSGFAVPPLVDIGGTGTGATAIAMIDGNGNLTNVVVTCPGVNYTGTPTFTFIGGGGVVTNGGSATTIPNTGGGLTQLNTGSVELDGVNTYAGNTTVNASLFTMGGGGLLGGGNYRGTISFNSGSTVFNYNSTNSQIMSGPITSSGTLAMNVNNGVLLVNSNLNLGGGSIEVQCPAIFGGSGTITGNVTWDYNYQGDSTNGLLVTAVAGTNSTPLKIVGQGLNTDGNEILVNVFNAPLQPGNYVLMTCSGGINRAFDSTAHYAGFGAAAGTTSVINTDTTHGVVTLTVSYSGTVSVWTNGINGSWSVATNWNSNPYVPQHAGDVAILGAGSSNISVTLDASESVGVLQFTNANSFNVADAGSTLTLDYSGQGAAVSVPAGVSNSIGSAVLLNDNATVQLFAGSSLSITNVISSTSGQVLTVNGLSGGGTLALSGNNTYGPSAGTPGTTLSGATLKLGNNNALGAGDLDIASSATVQAGAGLTVPNNLVINSGVATVDTTNNSFTWSGNISGSSALTKVGSGTLTLSGGNSSFFNGPTTVAAGVLQAASSQALSGGATTVATNALLDLNGQSVYAQVILSAGGKLGNYSGSPAQEGGVVSSLPGSVAYLVGGGNLQLSQVMAGGNGSFDITNQNTGTLDLNGSSDNTFLNLHTEIGTTVLLDKQNSGSTVHSVSNLWVDGGLVQLAGSGGDQISDGGTLAMTNTGVFDMNGNSETVGFLVGSGLVTNSNPSSVSMLQVGGGNGYPSGAGTFSGLIADGGAGTLGFYKGGGGVAVLTGANTFSGNTTISNGTLSLNLSGSLGSGNYAGSITNFSILAYNSTVPQILSGVISGTGTNTLGTNANTLTLSGWNTYSGATIVNAGKLKAGSGMAFGTSTVFLNAPGMLDLNGQFVTNPVTWATGGVLTNSSASSSANLGNITAASPTYGYIGGVGNMYLWNISAANVFNVTNNLAGTLDLAGTNDNVYLYLHTYSGIVLLDKTNTAGHAVDGLDLEGSLVKFTGGNGDEIFDLGIPLTVNAGTLDMNGASETVLGLNGSGGVVLNNNAASPGTLVVGNSTYTNSSALQNGSGVLNFAKGGGGIQTLLGTNTFTGYAQVFGGGSLSVPSITNELGRVSGIILGGGGVGGTNGTIGTLLYTGAGETSDRVISFTATNAGSGQMIDQEGVGLLKFTSNLTNTGSVADTLTLTGNSAGNGEIAGNIPNGPSSLTSLVKNGTNTWTLSGTNSASGTATVNGGTLQLGGKGGTNWAGSVVVSSNATLGAVGTTPTVASNITWAAGSAAALTLNWNGSANTALFKVGGTVTLNNNSIAVNIGTAVGTGVYPLMTYNPGSSGAFAANNLTITGAGLPVNSVASLVVNGGNLNLVVRNIDVWTNNGNGSWTVASNWNPGYPHLQGDSAIFGYGAGLTTVNLNGSETVGAVTFTNVNSFVITSSAASILTVDNGGYGATISATAGISNAIAAPVILNENTTLNAAGGQGLALTGGVGGNAGLILSGSGTVGLGGSNTYSGVTTVNAGTLALGSTNAISTNALVINGGSLDSTVANLVNGKNNAQSWNASFGFVGSQNLNLGSGGVALANAGVTVTVNSNTLAVGGAISGAGGLTVQGTNGGALELDGVNTFAWFTNISGTVALGSDAALGTNATIQLTPVPGVTSVTFKSKDASTRTITNNVSANTIGGQYIMAGTGNLNFSGTMATGNGQKEFTVSNYTTFSGPVTDGGAPTNANIKDGTGTLALTASNWLTKPFTINAGTLSLGNSNALGYGVLTINGGGLDATVANMTLTNAQTWGGSFYFVGSTNLIMGTNKVTVSANTTISVSNNALTITSPINLTGQLAKAGPGTLVLSVADMGAGGVAVNAGTLKLGNAAALGTGTLTMNGGTLDVASSLALSTANAQVWNGSFGFTGNNSLNMGNGAVTMNADISVTNFATSTAPTKALTVGGNITGPGHALTKAGGGSVTLNGTNNYGNTTVNAGKLTIAMATLNTNSTVTIASGASLVLGFSTTNVVAALITNGVAAGAGVYPFAPGFLQVVPPPAGPSGPGYLTNMLSGATMNLSWPAGQGWRLQAQTNGLDIGISNNWAYVTSGSVNTYSVTVIPTNPAVFFRLTYP